MTCAVFTIFLCMLPMAVARSSSSKVIKSKKNGATLGFSYPLTMYCSNISGMNFSTKEQFHLNSLIYHKVRQNSIS